MLHLFFFYFGQIYNYRIREPFFFALIADWFGLTLSKGSINN